MKIPKKKMISIIINMSLTITIHIKFQHVQILRKSEIATKVLQRATNVARDWL